MNEKRTPETTKEEVIRSRYLLWVNDMAKLMNLNHWTVREIVFGFEAQEQSFAERTGHIPGLGGRNNALHNSR